MSSPIGSPNNLDRLNIDARRVESTDAATIAKSSKKRPQPNSLPATASKATKTASSALGTAKPKKMEITNASSSNLNANLGLHHTSSTATNRKTAAATHSMVGHAITDPSLATIHAHTPAEWHSQADSSAPRAITAHNQPMMDVDDSEMSDASEASSPVSASVSAAAHRNDSSDTDSSIDPLEDDNWGNRAPGGAPPDADPAAVAGLAAPNAQDKLAEIKQEIADLAKQARDLRTTVITFRQKTIETSKEIDNTDGEISTPKATYRVDKDALKKNEDELKSCIKKLWVLNEKFQALENVTDSPDVREILANVTLIKKDLFETRKIINDISFYDNTQTLYRTLNHFNKILETMNEQINDILHLPGLQPRFPDIF